MWQRGGGVSRTKCGKAEGNTKINVPFPNVFVLFGVSQRKRGQGELNLGYISVKLNVGLLCGYRTPHLVSPFQSSGSRPMAMPDRNPHHQEDGITIPQAKPCSMTFNPDPTTLHPIDLLLHIGNLQSPSYQCSTRYKGNPLPQTRLNNLRFLPPPAASRPPYSTFTHRILKPLGLKKLEIDCSGGIKSSQRFKSKSPQQKSKRITESVQ